MFKDMEEYMNTIKRLIETLKQNQKKIVVMKSTMSKMKFSLDDLSWSGTTEGKICGLDGWAS